MDAGKPGFVFAFNMRTVAMTVKNNGINEGGNKKQGYDHESYMRE
jgi:hypothetical protein